MREKLSPRIYSRRKFLFKSAAIAGGFLVASDQILKDGLMTEAPSLIPNPKRINIDLPNVNFSGKESLQASLKQEIIHLTNDSFLHYNSDGDLIFQHAGAVFDPNRDYDFSHRSGNRRWMVDEAIIKGANGFDMDANDVGGGRILAEHGIVGSLSMGPISLGGVFDRNEGELRTRLPRTVSSMIDYIGSKSDPNDPYVLDIQFKRGSFDNQTGLFDIIDAILRNRIPTRVFDRKNQKAVDNLFEAAEEYSQSNNSA